MKVKNIMKAILCTPILLPFLILGLFIELLKFTGRSLLKLGIAMDRESCKWADTGTWLVDISDWIHKS